jgi:hypothetical protein
MNHRANVDVLKICRIPRISISGIHAHTQRNLLWYTPMLPTTAGISQAQAVAMSKASSDKCKRAFGVSSSETPLLSNVFQMTNSGYVLLNDEDDGFRILWISLETSEQHNLITIDDSSSCPHQ